MSGGLQTHDRNRTDYNGMGRTDLLVPRAPLSIGYGDNDPGMLSLHGGNMMDDGQVRETVFCLF